MAEADPIGALRAWLLADPDMVALVGDDVFGGELDGAQPDGADPEDSILDRGPKGAIVIARSGGVSLTGDSDADLDTPRIDLIAYGATPAEADAVMRTAAPRLKAIRRETINGVLIHWAKPAGGSGPARDSDTQWPQAFRSFQILYSTEEIQ